MHARLSHHFQHSSHNATGYASNPASITPSRGHAVSTAHTYQPQYSTASNFPVPQALPQALQVSAPISTAEYEALRNQAHEAYRSGDFHTALQLCQSVRSALLISSQLNLQALCVHSTSSCISSHFHGLQAPLPLFTHNTQAACIGHALNTLLLLRGAL